MDEDEAGSGTSFDQRLQDARARQGLDPPPPAPIQPANDASSLALFLRVSVELVSAPLVGLAIGWGLDRLLGTRPLFLVLLVLLGGLAGFVNIWRVLGRAPAPGQQGSDRLN